LKEETLVVLMADHGQIHTRKDDHYDIKTHPNFARRLPMMPTGENRLVYLFIRPGQTEAVREYIDRTFLKQFALVDPGYAVEAGLFGPGEPHPRLRDRLGDLIAIPAGCVSWWTPKENPIFGRHGGIGEEEMLVPFLAAGL
ncbi:MAG: alkaline phosphatase family protein, partial [Anaerolineae bacterium]|nr:alkaline phosphatase family protein [Anaerolineae bacterium]